MITRRLRSISLWALAVLVLLSGVAALAWLLFFRSGEEDAVRQQTEAYFSRAIEGQPQEQYDMLDSSTRGQISLADWQQRNDAALQATGPLRQAKVTSVEVVNSKEAYASIELTFGDAEPLPVVVPLVKEEGKWKLSLSVSEDAADQWQHVQPTQGP